MLIQTSLDLRAYILQIHEAPALIAVCLRNLAAATRGAVKLASVAAYTAAIINKVIEELKGVKYLQ
jgi:hypothetical protein